MRSLIWPLPLLGMLLLATPSWGQRVVLPSTPGTSSTLVPVQPYGASPGVTTPLTPGTVPATAPGMAPAAAPSGATLSAPFDPYSPSGVPAAAPPSPFGAPGAPPAANPYGVPGATTPTNPWASMPGGTGYPSYPGYSGPPGQPSSLFPNGFGNNPNQPPMRLIDNLRFQESWVSGGSDPTDLGINDLDFATTFQFPNFFGTTTPLMITPEFVLSLWDGPAFGPPQDLPANAYAAFVDFAWKSNPALVAGADLSVSVGAFTDFNTFTDNSIRIQGLGLAWVRLTPQMMLKLGVNYIDRVDIKLLPAVGVLWEPNPNMKLDIYFPRPKLAFRMTKMQGADVWLYANAEYGGGSWTIEHANGSTDQIDINDIRIGGGIEWVGHMGFKGHFEIAWVMSREVVYRYNPTADINPPDSIMLRAGIAY